MMLNQADNSNFAICFICSQHNILYLAVLALNLDELVYS